MYIQCSYTRMTTTDLNPHIYMEAVELFVRKLKVGHTMIWSLNFIIPVAKHVEKCTWSSEIVFFTFHLSAIIILCYYLQAIGSARLQGGEGSKPLSRSCRFRHWHTPFPSIFVGGGFHNELCDAILHIRIKYPLNIGFECLRTGTDLVRSYTSCVCINAQSCNGVEE